MKPIELIKAAVDGRSARCSKRKTFQGVHCCRIRVFFMRFIIQMPNVSKYNTTCMPHCIQSVGTAARVAHHHSVAMAEREAKRQKTEKDMFGSSRRVAGLCSPYPIIVNTANLQTYTKCQATSPLRQEGDESHASGQELILRMSTFHCTGLEWTRCRMSYDSYDPMILDR